MEKTGELILYPIYDGSEDFVSSLSIYMDSKNRAFSKIKNKKGLDKFLTYAYDPIFSIREYFEGKDSLEYRLGLDKTPTPKDYALIPLREPGRTIGHIKISKELLITEIVVYEDSVYKFKKDMSFDEFIGKEVVIVEFNEIVFKPSNIGKNAFVSPLTALMDEYLKDSYDKEMFTDGYSYLHYTAFDSLSNPDELVYALRSPGATRANMIIDRHSLKIKRFMFIDVPFNMEYNEELKEKLNKYIDKKINIRNWRG